jgi:hypothetical protein
MSNFVDPSDFDGVIPGRGRKPNPVAIEVSVTLKGCPIGKGLLVTRKEFIQESPTGRAKIRAALSTAATLAGWGSVSVRWTDQNQPFVVRAS